MTIIYRLLEINNEIKEEYYKSIAGTARAASMKYREYLLSKELLYTEGVNPPDITEESVDELFVKARDVYEEYATVTLVCMEEYTLSITEVELRG